MNKAGKIIYIVVCLLFCSLPFIGMTFYKTDATTENKTLAAFPKWEQDGKWNENYFDELSAYFNDHFAFRRELVTVDAEIQSKVFQVSNVDTVAVGTDGWLYYTDTVDDYLGQDIMTERQVFNAANNMRQLQEYVERQGAGFVLTVAPNKNSLYGANMPYYLQYKVSDTKNVELLKPALESQGVFYVDLFETFKEQDEVLYLKRDSHWNNKGAILAYDTIMDTLVMNHETFEETEVIREKKEYGDLNKMLYPLTAKPEWNYYPSEVKQWSYVSEEANVEAAWIETACEEGEGTLLMFRDSFGNTLLPIMAQQFKQAYFSKAMPYNIAEYMETCNPELVVVEKVERNIDEFMTQPPIMQGLEQMIDYSSTDGQDKATGSMEPCAEDANYYMISGEVDASVMSSEARILLGVFKAENNAAKGRCYEAFTVTTDKSDYGYRLYLSKEELIALGVMTGDSVKIDVIVENDEEPKLVGSFNVTP